MRKRLREDCPHPPHSLTLPWLVPREGSLMVRRPLPSATGFVWSRADRSHPPSPAFEGLALSPIPFERLWSLRTLRLHRGGVRHDGDLCYQSLCQAVDWWGPSLPSCPLRWLEGPWQWPCRPVEPSPGRPEAPHLGLWWGLAQSPGCEGACSRRFWVCLGVSSALASVDRSSCRGTGPGDHRAKASEPGAPRPLPHPSVGCHGKTAFSARGPSEAPARDGSAAVSRLSVFRSGPLSSQTPTTMKPRVRDALSTNLGVHCQLTPT